MMTDIDYLIVIIAAFLGSLGSGYFGYLKSGEAFNIRKFLPSIWSAVVSAMVFALGFQKTSDIATYSFILAFLGGAGVDVLTNRAQLTSTTPTTPTLTKEQEARIQKIEDQIKAAALNSPLVIKNNPNSETSGGLK